MAEPASKRAKLIVNGEDSDLQKLAEVKEEPKEETGTLGDKLLEDLSQDEAKKEEVKQENGDEVKVEVKEEADDLELDQLMEDANADGAGVEGGGSKKKKRIDDDGTDEVLPDVPAVDSETEYEQPDLASFPQKLRIEACIQEKLNGVYRIMTKASRGRPCYCKTSSNKEKKTVYLYFHSNKRWHLGHVFGSKQCFASCASIEATFPPVEPYPNVWKVLEKAKKGEKEEKEKKDKVKCLQMRVTDAELWEESQVFGEGLGFVLPDEINYNPQEPAVVEKEQPDAPPPAKSSKKSSSRGSPQKAVSSTASAELDDEAAMVAAAAAAFQDSDDEKAPSAPRSSQKEDKDNESDSNENDDDDESESEESSSSESASDAAVPSPKAKTAASGNLKDMSPSAASVCSKLKSMPTSQAAEKAARLVQSLRTKIAKGDPANMNNMTLPDLQQIIAYCCREFGVPDEPLPSMAKQATTLRKQEKQEQAAGAPTTPDMPASVQPHTPPQELAVQKQPAAGGAMLPHRNQQPKKSAFKYGPRNFARRIAFVPTDQLRNEVGIVSFKTAGELLWFQCPGAIVNCDNCDRAVPQAMGSLQGAPTRSQFAQNEFLCSECIQQRIHGQI